jgi:hypothetical protein
VATGPMSGSSEIMSGVGAGATAGPAGGVELTASRFDSACETTEALDSAAVATKPLNKASAATAHAPPKNICFNATPSPATPHAKPKGGAQVFLFILAAQRRPERNVYSSRRRRTH